MTGPNKKSPRVGSQELTTAISAILAMTGTASAQDQSSSGATLEEVIVTATKREERLQDVPESITAISSDDILKRGLFQMDDYARLVPGLAISDREPGGTTIVFRGVATSGLQFGSVSSSSLYLDEQPITQSGRNPDPRLIDVDRVEALRGPQGTLYGASSQSGTLRIITNKPDPTKLETWFDAQLSNVNDGGMGYDLSAMINVPLVADRLALRLVGFTAEDAGFIDNVLSDSQGGTFDNENVVGKDVNTTKTTGGRAALGLNVTDNVQATLSAVFQDVHADGHSDVNHGAGDLHQVRFEKETLDDHWYQVALTLDASLPFGQAVVAASYFNRDFEYEADATDYEFQFNQTFINCDPSPTYDCTPTYDFGGDPRGFAKNKEETEITTLEARLSSKTGSESRWSWLVGAFYSEEKGKTAFDSFVRGYENTRLVRVLQLLRDEPDRQHARSNPDLVSGPLRYRARPGGGVRRAELRCDRELHHHGGRTLVRLRPQVRTDPGATGRLHRRHRASTAREKTSENGTVLKLNGYVSIRSGPAASTLPIRRAFAWAARTR